MVNWDPKAKTTLSNEEVIYEEVQSKIYYIKYRILDSNDSINVATTRPETIFGDTAIAFNPKDNRYKHLIGKKAIIPILNKKIPIINDNYVDPDFGTGCLKVTPAHSENDKIIGDKHNLEIVDILNDDGTLNVNALHYAGKDRFFVRKEIVKELDDLNSLIKEESYVTKVGKSERLETWLETFTRTITEVQKELDVLHERSQDNKLKIASHEASCDVRYANIMKMLENSQTLINSQNDDLETCKNLQKLAKLA